MLIVFIVAVAVLVIGVTLIWVFYDRGYNLEPLADLGLVLVIIGLGVVLATGLALVFK